MKIILIGPPGVGKGTQGSLLAEKLDCPVISTGQVIRNAIRNGSQGSDALKTIVSRGELVPDALMVEILDQRLASNDCHAGYILDGFPRTLSQAETLSARGVEIDYVIEFFLNDQEIVNRLSGRLYHPDSGRIYHKVFNPPKKLGLDDVTGEALVIREDDMPESIIKRLELFKAETSPLKAYYQARANNASMKYIAIDASGSVDEIHQHLIQSID